ncbi:general transcription factor 3C polypeptide 1-like [Melanotaenia boesemani]|uniref:general transcription factor 3C polypeptide 1-like n=1 Tax=Melanotaenia boesemani TaxID=1250792 RepID=UPI001C05DD54|nr:general transcription factor 3C polypeptide 1-like [Melanotaenia boesemani]
MDPLSIVEDEVALEGLDGITIPTLWIRLEDRQSKFPLKLDDSTKGFIWRSLVNSSDLRFYEMPREREDVELFDRFRDIDPETAIEVKERCLDEHRDVYPVHVIPENKDGIQGSCAVFKERKDVTKQIRSKSLTPLVNVEEAMEKYGRKLVVVASQAQRFRALIGIESDPDLKLSSDSYCVLERVGRARWQGELQRDLHGGPFKADARKFHYLRKSLVKHELVTMQPCVKPSRNGQQQHSILLLLKRFHVNRRPLYDMMTEYVSNFLQQQPRQLTTLATIKDHLNLNGVLFRRLFKYIRVAGLTEFCHYPLEDLDPSAEPCTTKNGNKVRVRCLKLIKPYVKKGVMDDDDDDEDEDNNSGAIGLLPSDGRIMEKDLISQAYHIILSSGTKGIPQRSVALKMNISKLESRTILRKLERDGFIKGFMEDEGRQRTTKYISHKCVGVSDQLQLFAKEQERNKLLYPSPQVSGADPSTSKTPASSKLPANKNSKTSAAKKQKRKKDAEVEQKMCDDGGEDVEDEGLGGKKGKGRGKMGRRHKMSANEDDETTNQIQTDIPIIQPTPAESETPACSGSVTSLTPDSVSIPAADQASVKEGEQSNSASDSTLPQSEVLSTADNPANNVVVVDSALKPQQRIHETYRLLKRKNLIVEAVQKMQIIEGLFPLLKIISDEEKQDGFSSKCCKKTVLRLVQSLSREGLLKLYTTTVIQDGLTKKIDMVVHPSIQPNDERVSQLIEQVRFRISSSYSAVRQHNAEEKAKEKQKRSKSLNTLMTEGGEDDADFKPSKVRGLGKTFGFQPKMLRLSVIHNFLWYLIYGHSLRGNSAVTGSPSETPTDRDSSNPDAKQPDNQAQQHLKEKESPGVSNLDVASGDEEELSNDKSKPNHSESNLKVYADEDSWRRFVPPVRQHKDFTSGWAMVGDLLLCLPLSTFMQVIQISYKVDGLEEYLNDPVKQHYLVRALPAKIKRQLLYKRKYIHSFHENLQRLTYMGLLQFGVAERFKDKDQVCVYLKRNATIVDTTNTEPHYWLVTESPDNPFERRRYTFNTAEDVESYWFDLMCVCLNTPLGIIRSKKNATEDEAPSFVPERYVFVGLSYLLKGSHEVCDDGSIPGDGKGAGGLDSEFFGHLKRNWLWTNHLLACKKRPSGSETPQGQVRLRSLLGKNASRIALQAAGTTSPRYLTMKQPRVAKNVEVGTEPASRNRQVVGGKGQRRKRSKKEVVKVPRRKRKEPKKRTAAHDEADHRALKMMTKQRVYWSVQEDSLIMLCSVASYLLNTKLKRPFIPYCVVRDLLHAEFEISVDKTSIAVSRRTRYILKNPHSLLNYRICVVEVYQDKTLMRLLEEAKPADPNKPEDCAKAFSEYVRLLRQKFSCVMNAHDVVIPDSKQHLFSKFKVSAIDDGKQFPCKDIINSKGDIHVIVLHNLIQSTLAMTNSQMKSSRSFQTFHMYSKFDQELLCEVFIQCRKRRLVNRRRVSNSFGPKKNRALPILPMSYQLSQSYYRCFSWRFPPSLCTDSFCFLRNLITSGTGDERPVTTFYHESEIRSQNGKEVLERKADSARKEKQSGGKEDCRQPEVVDIDSTKDSSHRTMEGEDKLMESDVNNEKTEGMSKLEQHKKPESSLISGSVDASASKEQPDKHPPDVSESSPDVSDMLQFSLNSPGGACVVCLGLMTLGLLNVHLSIPKQIVVVDSNLVDNDVTKSMAVLEEDDDEDDGEECEGRKRPRVTSHQASHTNYLMMRGYCLPGIVKLRNINTGENIVVESCIMSLQLRNTPAHCLFSEENSPPLDLTKCGPSLLPPMLTSYIRSPLSSPPSVEECDRLFLQQRGYTTQDVEACAQLRRSLDEAGENGLDERDFFRAHVHLQVPESGRTRSLLQYLKDLQEEVQVVKVGSLGVRWVLMQHAEPWLLTINSKQLSWPPLTSERRPSLKSQHSIPFLRKRCSREVHLETEGPPAKKPALDGGKGPDRESVDGSSCSSTDKPNEEEQQKERADEGSGDKLLNVEEEGRVETLSKEEGEEVDGQVETVKRHDKKRELRTRRSSLKDERHEDEHSPPLASADDEENSSFISRPWRLVDGKLNRPVCKGMLEAVLFHIMSQPGLTQESLVKHYKDVLQPLAVIELVQALIDLGCITKKTLVKDPKPSLFARSVHQRRSETTVNVEEPDTVFYEPTISCCLRLCRVLPNERHWNDWGP